MRTSGDTAPSFTLPTNDGGILAIPTDQPLVVYFYPKDDTPGCTTEAQDFSRLKPDFSALGIEIVGISADTVHKHEKFSDKYQLSIKLASDENHDVSIAYGVWVEKNMYGRKFMGIQRATFLIDSSGKILEAWQKVKVKGHADAVLESARQHFS